MSTLTLLPLVRVTDGVQPDEDWRLTLAFYLNDGVTPIDLSALEFVIGVGDFATLTSAAGQIVVGGPSNNLLIATALAAQKADWPLGVYPLSLSAGDGVYTRDLFASSTLAIGSAQMTRVTLLVAPDPVPSAVVSPLPAALAAAFQALQPSALASALASLQASSLLALAQALFASLPVQTGADAPVSSGQPFVNRSGYVVIAQ